MRPLPEDAPLDRRIGRLEIIVLKQFPSSPAQKATRAEIERLKKLRDKKENPMPTQVIQLTPAQLMKELRNSPDAARRKAVAGELSTRRTMAKRYGAKRTGRNLSEQMNETRAAGRRNPSKLRSALRALTTPVRRVLAKFNRSKRNPSDAFATVDGWELHEYDTNGNRAVIVANANDRAAFLCEYADGELDVYGDPDAEYPPDGVLGLALGRLRPAVRRNPLPPNWKPTNRVEPKFLRATAVNSAIESYLDTGYLPPVGDMALNGHKFTAADIKHIREFVHNSPEGKRRGARNPSNVDSLWKKLESLRTQVASLESERDSLRMGNAAARWDETTYKREFARLTTKITALRKRVSAAFKAATGAQERLQKAHDNRRNPEADLSAAESLYETFHGKPSTRVTEFISEHDCPDGLAELGPLVELWVLPVKGRSEKAIKITAPDPEGEDAVYLASDPEGTQLYFVGGDQELDLENLGFDDSEHKRRVTVGVLQELTYRTKKGFHKFKTTDYFHKLGEETGNEPFLTYDAVNGTMGVSGGAYKIEDRGIVN